MSLENRATLSMQHYAAVTTAICNILDSRSRATMALMFVPLHHNGGGQLDELRKPRPVRLLRPEPCPALIRKVQRTVATLVTVWRNATNIFC